LLLIALVAFLIVRARRSRSTATPTEPPADTPLSSTAPSPRTLATTSSTETAADDHRSSADTEYGVIHAMAPPNDSYARVEAQPYQKVYSTVHGGGR
jgi:hypothetical protein